MNKPILNEPKYLVSYLSKRLKGRKYKLTKSPLSGNKTYYFKSEILGQRIIRVSNHHLHENQYKASQIDIVIETDLTVTINKIPVKPIEPHSYRSVVADEILKILSKIK